MASEWTTAAADVATRGDRLGARIFRLRLLGLNLGAIAVGAVLLEQGRDWPYWVLLLANSLLWPLLARTMTLRSRDPKRQEEINLMIDSALGGVWLPVMQFSLGPSLLLVATLSMDKVAFGGWRFLARTASAQLAACLVVGVLLGFPVQLASSVAVLVACVPHALIYPLLVASATERLLTLAERQRIEITKLARTDLLTGVLNRGYWEQIANEVLESALRSGRPAALVIVDIDRFKLINDQRGHVVGDRVIRACAEAVSGAVRGSDQVGRYGGDEFAIALPQASATEAQEIAHRIQQRIEAIPVEIGSELNMTASIGVAPLLPGTRDVDEWLQLADAALYQAKSRGRNRVVMASQPG